MNTAAPPAPGTLEHQVDLHPQRTAIVDGARRLTWREWDERASRLANALRDEIGIGAGDRIAIRLHNRAEWFETSFALAKLRAISTSVGRRLAEHEVRYIVEQSSARALVLDDPALAGAATAWLGTQAAPSLHAICCVGSSAPEGALAYETLLARGGSERRFSGATTVASSIVYTSGTTGRPKGAVRAVDEGAGGDLAAMLADLLGTLDVRPGDRHLVCCPLYHAAPPAYAHFNLAVGGSVVIMGRFDPEEALRLIECERITSTFMVPTQLNRIVSLPESVRGHYDVSALRALITGASPFPTSVKERVIEMLGDSCLFEFYGSTETGLNTILEPRDQRRKPGSCGRLLAGNDIRILDEEGREVPTGQLGQLYIRSPVLIRGYHDDEHATRECLRDGYFTVGDVGTVDEDGFYYIVDRLKDMIISGGVNIYPAEIEAVLCEHPSVFDAAVIGIPHGDWGEELKAIVELRAGGSATEEELIALCRARLADFKHPRSVEFVKELPRNPTGKILKRVLREPYWAGAGRRI